MIPHGLFSLSFRDLFFLGWSLAVMTRVRNSENGVTLCGLQKAMNDTIYAKSEQYQQMLLPQSPPWHLCLLSLQPHPRLSQGPHSFLW